jgi:hypothetical protein
LPDAAGFVAGTGDFAALAAGFEAATLRALAAAAAFGLVPALAFVLAAGTVVAAFVTALFATAPVAVLAGRFGLEGFLCDSFDMRLPFVAFGGSIMRVFRVLTGAPEQIGLHFPIFAGVSQ